MTSRFTFLVAALLMSGLMFVAMPAVQAQVECGDCDVTCGNGGNKILLCHIPDEVEAAEEAEEAEPTEICIAAPSLDTHCEHGDTCGSCEVAE